ncbi:MAG: CaiB/BaiF CoA-transferase family protein [Actinomycetota bacterium]|nr:CaiB/BaiF CoA-transferase family protein [Actinomycetota bacterium]
MSEVSHGALLGVKVIEMGGPPGAFGSMFLADHGAEVLRIGRPAAGASVGATVGLMRGQPMDRGKRAVSIDLSRPEGVHVLRDLISRADVFIEGFRPGVTERMGVGPVECLSDNPRLVYARMTGWGQSGDWAMAAGHDLNYVALSGTLHTIGGHDGPPIMPVNYLGDWAGGLLLAFGITAALHAVGTTGRGQIIDCAMLDSAAVLASVAHAGASVGYWKDARASNMTDGGTPYYAIYATADGKHVAVGALEPKFYATLIARMGLADTDLPPQYDESRWHEIRTRFTEVFLTKTRAEWVAIMDGVDACFAPVLSLTESWHHPHNVSRSTFVDYEGAMQPAPAPRLSATPAAIRPWAECAVPLADTLAGWGLDPAAVKQLADAGTIGEPPLS